MPVCIFIHIAHCKTVGGGLQRTVLFIALLEFRSCPGREVRIAGAIHIDSSPVCGQAGFVIDDDSLHGPFAVCIHRTKHSVKQHLRAGACYHPVIDALQLLRINGYPVHSVLVNMGHFTL
ncbi:hypothetical protein D3C75_821160 [compost metagenome]